MLPSMMIGAGLAGVAGWLDTGSDALALRPKMLSLILENRLMLQPPIVE